MQHFKGCPCKLLNVFVLALPGEISKNTRVLQWSIACRVQMSFRYVGLWFCLVADNSEVLCMMHRVFLAIPADYLPREL